LFVKTTGDKLLDWRTNIKLSTTLDTNTTENYKTFQQVYREGSIITISKTDFYVG